MRGLKNIIILSGIVALGACSSSNMPPVGSANNPDQSIPNTVVTNSVFFAFNGADVPANANKLLTVNASYLIAHPVATVQIQGNSSEVGTTSHNQELGLQRAQNVKAALVKLGASAKQISVISFGNTKPVYANNDKGLQPKNQRADIVYTNQAPYQYRLSKVPHIDTATMY